jgi:hypothetical protein
MTVFGILLCAQCVAQTVDEKLTGRLALPPRSQQGHGSGRQLAEVGLLVSPIPSQEVTSMPRPVAHLLDPALADAADPCAGYNPEAEPLEDRLYLPVGVDPHGDICGVVFAHPYPQSKEVLTQRIIRNNNLQDMRWLIETGVTTGCHVPDPARLRLRGHQRLLAGATQLSAPRRQCHCHGLRSPDQPRPWQWHARCQGRPQRRLHHHQGLQAGRVICHAHPLPEPLASLREYCRLHHFLTSYSVAIQNRMHCLRSNCIPNSTHFSASPSVPPPWR